MKLLSRMFKQDPILPPSVYADSRFQFIVILLLAVTIIVSKLGGTGIANYDDCFYAQKAKEILVTGDWMTMHYANRPAFENPPFFMWTVAVSYLFFGVGEYAAILPSAISGVLSIALVYFFGKKYFSSWIGFFSSIVLATTFYFTKYARHAMMDVMLSFFVLLAMYFLLLAVKKDTRYFFLWSISICIAILIKSVLGFFPVVITVLFLVFTGRWKIIIDKYFILSVLMIVLFGFSWYLNQYLKFGNEFLSLHFGWLIFTRGYNLDPQPWTDHLSYFKDLLTYHLLWIPFWLYGTFHLVRKTTEHKDTSILLMLWIVAYIGIMSTTMSRMFWYIMPIFPAAAIVTGFGIDHLLTNNGKIFFVRTVLFITICLAVIINTTPLKLSMERETDTRILSPYLHQLSDSTTKIYSFRFNHYGINNALLFYSDRVSTVIDDYSILQNNFSDSSLAFCIMQNSDFDSAPQSIHSFYIVRKTENFILLSNQYVNASSVKAGF